MQEGFFYLKSKSGKQTPTLVHGYHCRILQEFVYGFNTHDGGGVLRLSDVTDDCMLIPVQVVEMSKERRLYKDMGKMQERTG